jgi:hypothetical protein
MTETRLRLNIMFALLVSYAFFQCKTILNGKREMNYDERQKSYLVKRTSNSPEINADWKKGIWRSTKPLILENYMGDKPTHFPETKVKMRYDKDNIYLIFSVMDKYVKAVAKEINGKVWMDSCVEFFFSPGSNTERGYFNFEANCKGVFLFNYHLNNSGSGDSVSMEDCEKVRIAYSLKSDVEQEIAEPLEWRLEYSIPISVLKKYMKVDEPGPGVSWRANFYKCADQTSHPHWLTWARVDYPQPKFHLPEFFGRLIFE